MPASAAMRSSNRLIAHLPARLGDRLLALGELVELEFDAVLCESGTPYREVYFPSSGFISLVSKVRGHPPLDMGLIGSEGMLGVTLVLDVVTAPLRAVVQGGGSAWRIPAGKFRELVRDSEGLRSVLHRYLFASFAQLAHGTACTRFHEIEPRLARWLLLTHDRAHGERFHLTHQYLADMLGVQRSAITIAAGALQSRQLIQYSRGEISVLDRAGLQAAACECYAIAVNDYNEQFD